METIHLVNTFVFYISLNASKYYRGITNGPKIPYTLQAVWSGLKRAAEIYRGYEALICHETCTYETCTADMTPVQLK